jgi:hypothetical protein
MSHLHKSVDYMERGLSFNRVTDTRSPLSTPQAHTTNMRYQIPIAMLLILIVAIKHSDAIPGAYGACQTSCAILVAGCYCFHGAVFGAVRAAGASPAILRCNVAFAKCQATCASIWIPRAIDLTAVEQLEQQMGGLSLGPKTSEEEAVDALRDGFAKMNLQ